VDNILSKLVEIEAALRGVREELAKVQAASDVAQNEAIDFGKLNDVTPDRWSHWFDEFKFGSPTPIAPYQEFFPNIMIGYANDGEIRTHIEQTPYVSTDAKVRYGLQIWLVKPVDWLTVELWIPPQQLSDRSEFFLSWRCSVGNSQNVDIYIFERDASDMPLRRKIATRFFPSLSNTDILKVPINVNSDIVDRKIYFSFSPNSFHSITLEDVRLLVMP